MERNETGWKIYEKNLSIPSFSFWIVLPTKLGTANQRRREAWEFRKNSHQTTIPPASKIIILKVPNEPAQTSEIYEWIKNQIGNQKLLILARFQTGAQQNDLFLAKYNTLATKSGDTFLTFHASKGLEADNVVVVGLNEWTSWDSIPSRNMDSVLNTYVQYAYEERNLYLEERRLFYVALTRSKKKLFLVSQFDSPSKFLKEIMKSPQVEVMDFLPKFSLMPKNSHSAKSI